MLQGNWHAAFCAPCVKCGCASSQGFLAPSLIHNQLEVLGMLDLTKNSPDNSVGHDRFLLPKRTGFVLRWSQGSRKKNILGKKLNCGLEIIVYR